MKKNSVLLTGILLIYLMVIVNYYGGRSFNVISWDVYGYYVYLPGIFNYQDVAQFDFSDEHLAQYQMSTTLYQLTSVTDGRAPIYTMGIAMLWLPFYAIGHLIATFSDNYLTDGMSMPYQWMVIVASVFYSFVGLFLVNKILQRWIGTTGRILTILVLTFGTNFFHYVIYEPGMSHQYLFALYALLFYQTLKWHDRPNWTSAILGGLAIGLLCVGRPTELVCLLIPLLYNISSKSLIREKWQQITANFSHVIVAGIVSILCVLPQIIYWKIFVGKWVFNAYADAGHYFDFFPPHVWEGFFSYRKGWLIYTPLMTLALLGFGFVYKKHKSVFWSIFPWFFFFTWIVFAWYIWWYAGTFGARPMIQAYAILAIPLGVLIDSFYKNKILRVALSFLILLGIGLNLFQDWQYRQKILVRDGITKTFYWRSFGNTTLEGDIYKHLDVDEYLPDAKQRSKTYLGGYDFIKNEPMDSTIQLATVDRQTAQMLLAQSPFGKTTVVTIDEDNLTKFRGKWLEVKTDVWNSGDLFDGYTAARIVTSIEHNGNSLKWIGVRFQWHRPFKTWNEVVYHTKIPADIPAGSQLRFFVWNTSPDTIYTKKMKVNLLE